MANIPLYRYFVYSLIDGHLSCSHLLVTKNNDAKNICAQVFVWTCALIYLGYVPRSVIAGANGTSMVNFFRKY